MKKNYFISMLVFCLLYVGISFADDFADEQAVQFGLATSDNNATTSQGKVSSDLKKNTVTQAHDVIRASLEPRQRVLLSSGIAAVVQTLPFKEGMAFKKGDTLLSFDCGIEEAEHHYAKAEHKAARATLNANEKLNKLNAVGSLEVQTSSAKVEMAKARLDLCNVKLRSCKEIAPFDGRILKLYINKHERAKVGDPLIEIIDPGMLEAHLRVPSGWLTFLKIGKDATTFDLKIDETGNTLKAKVVRIGALADAVSQTIDIVAEVDTKGGPETAGMSGEAIITK